MDANTDMGGGGGSLQALVLLDWCHVGVAGRPLTGAVITVREMMACYDSSQCGPRPTANHLDMTRA